MGNEENQLAEGDDEAVVQPGRRRFIVRPGEKEEKLRVTYFEDSARRASESGDVLGTQLLSQEFSRLRAELAKVEAGYEKYSMQAGLVGDLRKLIYSMVICLGKVKIELMKSRAEVLADRAVWDGFRRGTGVDIAADQTSVGELLRAVHQNALLASRLTVPNGSEAYRALCASLLCPGSYGDEIMKIIGDSIAGTSFMTRGLRSALEKSVGHECREDSVVGAVRRVKIQLSENPVKNFMIRSRVSGNKFANFYELYPLSVAYVSGDLSEVAINAREWGDSFFIRGKPSRVRDVFYFLTSHVAEFFKWADVVSAVFPDGNVDKHEVLRALWNFCAGVEREFLKRLAVAKSSDSGAQSVGALKKVAGSEYVLRKRRDRDVNPDGSIEIVLENRLVAMNKWIDQMASKNTPLEKVLWEMFQHGLGTDVSICDLARATGLLESEVVCAVERGSKDGKSLFEKSKKTVFEVVSSDEQKTLRILL